MFFCEEAIILSKKKYNIYIYIYIYTRIKQHVPMKICNFIGGPLDNLRNRYRSSMAEHLINNCDCAEKFSVKFFSVLSKF